MTSGHLEIETKFDVDDGFARPGSGRPARRRDRGRAGGAPARGRLPRHRRPPAAPRADHAAPPHRAAPTPAGTSSCRPEPPAGSCTPRWAARSKNPPEALREPVTGILRGATARPGGDAAHPPAGHGAPRRRRAALAEVADDTVTATPRSPGPDGPRRCSAGARSRWSSVDGDEALAAAVGERLVAAGARPSASASKIGRVLAGRLAAEPAAPTARTKRPDGGGVRARRTRPSRWPASRQADLMLRTEQPDAVHQLRVSARRLRSTLAAFRPVLDRDGDRRRSARSCPGSAGELSDARDGEVALAHLRELVAAEPEELVLGPVAARLQQARDPRGPGRAGPGAAHAVGAAVPRGCSTTCTRCSPTRRSPTARGSAVGAGPRDALRRSVQRLRRRLATAAPAPTRPTARARCTTSARRPSGSGTPPRPAAARCPARTKLVEGGQEGADGARRGAGHRGHPRATAAGSGSRRPPRGRTPSPTAGCTRSSRRGPSGGRRSGLEPKLARCSSGRGSGPAPDRPPGRVGRAAVGGPVSLIAPARLRHRRPARDAAAARLPVVPAGPQHHVPGPAAPPADAPDRRAGAAPGAGGGACAARSRSTRPPRWTGSPTAGSGIAFYLFLTLLVLEPVRLIGRAAPMRTVSRVGPGGTAERGTKSSCRVGPGGSRAGSTNALRPTGDGSWPRCRPGDGIGSGASGRTAMS